MISRKTLKNDSYCESDTDYRLRIIAPLIACKDCSESSADKKERTKLIKNIARENSLSERTIRRWLKSYKEQGINGLKSKYPAYRSDRKLYIDFEKLLDEAVMIRYQSPFISVREIINCLEGRHPNIEGIIKRSTLQRHLTLRGVSCRELKTQENSCNGNFFGRYRKSYVLEQVQGDFKEPPRDCIVNENGLPVKVYIQLWIDNCSRKILTYKVALNQTQDVALESFKNLLEQYGIPEAILTDQGAPYRGKAFEHCTDLLNIKHKRSRPYRPESKGANERINGTMEQILKPVRLLKNMKFDSFLELFEQWVDEYNNTKHSALAEFDENNRKVHLSPNEVFQKSKKRCRFAAPDLLEHAFKVTEKRKVSKDGTFSYKGKLYAVPHNSCSVGQRVTIMHTTTSNLLELELRNSKKDVLAGKPEYEYVPLYELEVKDNVDFSNREKSPEKESNYANAHVVIPAEIERRERDIAKANGTYTTEEDFIAKLAEKLVFTPATSDETTKIFPSPYSKQINH